MDSCQILVVSCLLSMYITVKPKKELGLEVRGLGFRVRSPDSGLQPLSIKRPCGGCDMNRRNLVVLLLSIVGLWNCAFWTWPALAEVDTAWVRIYKGPVDGVDIPSDLVVDRYGNVYVTGASDDGEENDSNYDYTTIKYDSSGNRLWVKRYKGPVNGWDWAIDMTLDRWGNVYVTGQSLGSNRHNDYATVKYDSLGNELWARRYNGPANLTDEASSIVVDGAGNVYVTGTSKSEETDDDYVTIKYDADGNQLWVARYNASDNGKDKASRAALDVSGNLYVTGSSGTIKYNTDGNLLWHAAANSSDIATDSCGNVFVIGYRDNFQHSGYVTTKYDSLGNELWVQSYEGEGKWIGEAFALALGGAGNVYVTGRCNGDYVTLKYGSDGNQLWVQKYGGTKKRSENGARDVAVDASGNVYVTGASYSAGTHDDCVTIKYDPLGNQLWVARYNGPSSAYDSSYDVVVDGCDNVYISGSADGSNAGYDYVTIKYVQTGRVQNKTGTR